MPDGQLSRFFTAIASDDSISTTHIAIYTALYEIWSRNNFENPFSISRSKVMLMTKIGGKTTYHSHMKDLVVLGYIRYEPSYHPIEGSLVYLLNLNPKNDGIEIID